MKNQPENELLSAYLDGELTPAEQTRVEQLLAGSPSARKLLDELRTLGATMQSLPRQKLGADLSEQVLNAAAKRSPLPSEPGRPRPRPLSRQIVERIKNNPRLVVWPLVIVTVAVLLMVFNPNQNGPGRGIANRNIAMAPGDKNNEDRAVGAKIIEPQEGDLVKSTDQPSISAVKSPTVSPNPSHLVTKGNAEKGENQTLPSANSRAGLLVIQCQVSREVLQQQDYRKVFDANNVALSDKSASATLEITPSELAKASGIDRKVLEDNPNAADANLKAKVIAVEATPAQIAGMIDGLKAMPETFREVSMKTAQMPQAQPSTSAAPPTAKASPTKRVLFVFHVADVASGTKVQQSNQ